MKKLCTQCLYIGHEESNTFSNLKTESVLWGFAFFFAVAGAFETFLWLPATIMFFVALLYSIGGYTFHACVCSRCHSDSMIPLDSEKARQIMAERGLAFPVDLEEKNERTILGLAFKTILFILTTILVLFMLYDHFS